MATRRGALTGATLRARQQQLLNRRGNSVQQKELGSARAGAQGGAQGIGSAQVATASGAGGGLGTSAQGGLTGDIAKLVGSNKPTDAQRDAQIKKQDSANDVLIGKRNKAIEKSYQNYAYNSSQGGQKPVSLEEYTSNKWYLLTINPKYYTVNDQIALNTNVGDFGNEDIDGTGSRPAGQKLDDRLMGRDEIGPDGERVLKHDSGKTFVELPNESPGRALRFGDGSTGRPVASQDVSQESTGDVFGSVRRNLNRRRAGRQGLRRSAALGKDELLG